MLWVPITVFAALMQAARFVQQKRLKALGISTGGATLSRFFWAAPLAALTAAIALQVSSAPMPGLSSAFWAYALLGGLAQILATLGTVALFSLRNFATGIAFTKTETMQVAVFSALILAEPLPAAGWAAISVGFVGVILLSRTPGTTPGPDGRAVLLGVLAGGLFGISAICYRGATQELLPLSFFPRASVTLAVVTAWQTFALGLWLAFREPGELARVLGGWRATFIVGLTGMLGSLGWFAAFALVNAALVRSLGQVEIVFTLIAGRFLFGERLGPREPLGIALVIASVILIVLVAA